MMPIKIILVVGARPNFMKAAPLMKELAKYPGKYSPFLIHTGQHYDHNLSQLFFDELGMIPPDLYLGVGSKSHAQQTAQMMMELEKAFKTHEPDLVIVFGDVNSTMAAALVASKMKIKIAHVEAGLRSFDRSMPEEINRIVTDRLSDYLFTSEKSGNIHLQNEGVDAGKVFFVGNIMIDTLINNIDKAKSSSITQKLNIPAKEYVLLTLHRPSNVDDREIFESLWQAINTVSRELPVIFPCHPRTRARIDELKSGCMLSDHSIKIIDALGYLDFLNLQMNARFVLTDSGGIQEETTYLGIPCITIRENTERPVTVDIGTNVLAGLNPDVIIEQAKTILSGGFKKGDKPELWDGQTSKRIVGVLSEIFRK